MSNFFNQNRTQKLVYEYSPKNSLFGSYKKVQYVFIKFLKKLRNNLLIYKYFKTSRFKPLNMISCLLNTSRLLIFFSFFKFIYFDFILNIISCTNFSISIKHFTKEIKPEAMQHKHTSQQVAEKWLYEWVPKRSHFNIPNKIDILRK